jgi:hypothetical protein
LVYDRGVTPRARRDHTVHERPDGVRAGRAGDSSTHGTSAPDPNRLGGLEWTRRTRGRLSAAERRRLIVAIAVGQVENVLGRARLAAGRRAGGAATIEVGALTAPDSRLAREAEEACAEQPAAVAAHSYRTWMFGTALARLDRCELDRELFYCAALVHDYGIQPPVPGRDFTLGGADRALACCAEAGVSEAAADLIADAICVHPTPGIDVEHDGSLGCYVQWGAMVDGAGLRLWDVSRANEQAILSAHPRGPRFKHELAELVKGEAAAVPGGRFALLARLGMPLAVRLAPYRD